MWRNKSTDPLGSDTRSFETYDSQFADSRRWVKEGWVDYINPQVYWQIENEVAGHATIVDWWADVVKGTDVQLYVGHSAYQAETWGTLRSSTISSITRWRPTRWTAISSTRRSTSAMIRPVR